jgi:NIMA (never in mitosis gene a)-related kinase
VTDYADGGDLFEYIKNVTKMKATFKEDVIWLYLKQILSGLRYLHSKKIVHRDLKGANILLSADKRKVQVGDLNVSKIAKNSLLYTQTGTPYYASPEVWRDEPYDHKSDIWSLGCLIYEMAALKPPFLGKSMEELNASIQRSAASYPEASFLACPKSTPTNCTRL